MISFLAFSEEMQKIADAGSHAYHALELAGLGTLAAPAVAESAGKKVSDKTKRRAEIGGLGMLAATSAYHFAPQRVKNIVSAFAKKAAPAGLTGRMVKTIGNTIPKPIKPILYKTV